MMAELTPDEPEPRGASHCKAARGETAPSHSGVMKRRPSELLAQARQRFKELAVSCVQRCELKPEIASAVLHSLELGFARMIKEEGPVMQRQFGQDTEAAVSWAAERLVEASRHLAEDTPGRKTSPLQDLALLEVQALEMMVPELSRTCASQRTKASVPAAQLRIFCALLNDGLDFAHKANSAADRRDQHAYQGNYVLSRNKLRNAAMTLRRILRRADSETSELAVELRGFQLELAAYAGSIRMFLMALCARDAAAQSPGHHTHVLDPHCLMGDLLPVLFDRHFAFAIRTRRGIPEDRAQELVAEAHEAMWQKVALPVSTLLTDPGRLHPASFRDAVEAELRQAIKEVNQQYATERVVISIASNNAREIRRREW